MTQKQKILIALGSPSDKSEVLQRFRELKAIEGWAADTEQWLSVASAHRTPDSVEAHALEHCWDAIIAGAGLSNVLVSEYLKYADTTTVVIGLPLSDSKSKGLTSFLSTSELPPGYPVATVGIDRIDSALHLTNRLIRNGFHSISLVYATKNRTLERAIETLKELDVTYETNVRDRAIPWCEVAKGELPLYVLDPNFTKKSPRFGVSVEPYIACFDLGEMPLVAYLAYSTKNGHMAFVNSGENLALYGAKVLARHDTALKERIEKHLEKEKEKYRGYKRLSPLH